MSSPVDCRLTQQQEKFAVEYVKSGNREAAYKLAYDCSNSTADTVRKRAWEILQKARVAFRIMQLREQIANKVIDHMAINKEWVLLELANNMDMARKAGNLIAANKSLELIGAEIGMFQRKAEATPVAVHNNILSLPNSEWAEVKERLIGTIKED